MDRVKRIWYLLPMRAAKVQASLRIRTVSPEPPLLAHRSSESRGTLRQKARALAPLNGWACAVKICHDGMLEDTNSLDGAQMVYSTKTTVEMNVVTQYYRNDPTFSDKQAGANRRSSLIRVYTVCNYVCIFWTLYFMVKPPFSNFMGVHVFRKFTVSILVSLFSCSINMCLMV